MKTHQPRSDTLKHVKLSKIPYAKELRDTADLIADNVVKQTEEGKMGGIEAAGHVSMATLLAGVSDGSIPPGKAYPLLKTIAATKTPAPVQRIEAHQEVDMRAILFSAVQENPTALEDVVAIGIAAREQVRIRLGSEDNKLQLTPLAKTALPTDDDDALPETESLDEYSFNLREMGITRGISPEDVEIIPKSEPNKGWKPGEAPPEIERLRKEII